MHFTEAEEKRLALNPGDLLVCEGGDIGRTAIWNGALPRCYYQNHLHRARLRDNFLTDSQFALYWLWYAFKIGKVYFGRGNVTTIPNLSQSKLCELPLPVPPLPEQRKIAGILGVVQRAIEQQERLIVLTKELKKALMQKLFTEGLRGELQKQTEIGPVPESWDLVPCEDLCEMITVGVVVKPASHYIEKGIPAFRSFNVQEDRLALNNLVYFSENANDTALAKSKLRAGDVLVVRTGYPGTSCVVPKKYDGANCIDLVIVRPKDGVILSGFLSRFFNAPAGKDQAIAAKHGLAQQHLNVSAVKRTVVPVPPLEEQEEIDAALATVQQKIALITAKKDVLTTFFRTLLHQLMTAQLRVHDLDLDILECGDGSPLSYTGTRPGDQSAVVPAHSKRGRR
jgi:type I restriction enzyme S subunit